MLGLDISTSRTGVCVVERTGEDTVKRVFMGHIDLTKVDDLWTKVDTLTNWVVAMKTQPEFADVEVIGVEEPLMGFAGGKTSQQTIATLIRFNGLGSYVFREAFHVNPIYIRDSTARKKAGVKVQRVSECGIPVKQQVFNHMLHADLEDMFSVWPRKKPSKKNPVPGFKDACLDECDAYVIAKSTALLYG